MERFFSDPGSPIHVIRSMKIFPDGSSEVVPIGEENIQDYIQSFEESQNPSRLIARYVAGDLSALTSRSAMFGDFTQLPKTLTEMQQLLIDAGNFFDHLPVEVKQKFDNDVNKFIASSNDVDFIDKLGIFDPPVGSVVSDRAHDSMEGSDSFE